MYAEGRANDGTRIVKGDDDGVSPKADVGRPSSRAWLLPST